MKKRTFRVLALFVILSMLLATCAFAAMYASEYIAATSTWITRTGNTVKVNFTIVGTKTMDKIGVKYVYLYEKNGNSWNLVETFDYTDSDYDDIMMDSSSSGHAGYLPYSGYANKNYYADVRFYAEKNGGSDTIQQDTPTSYGTP